MNSRDYTDIYRLELWVLGYLKSFKKERALREAALTSHVQVPIPEMDFPKIDSLMQFLKLLQSKGRLWNPNILNMIKGYFTDMEIVFTQLFRVLKDNGMVYLNVSNSAYSESVCEVDNILGEIAQNVGFRMIEIRTARFVKSSSQQSLSGKLRESVLVLQKV